jgi:cell division protein FtsB
VLKKYLLWGLLLLMLVFQYQLWIGKYGFIRLNSLNQQLEDLQPENNSLTERNEALYAQVRELSEGSEVLEERARSQLGFVKEGEQFIQVVPDDELNDAPK